MPGDLQDKGRISARRWLRGPAQRTLGTAVLRMARGVARNLTSRRLLSFPHFLVAVWIVILLWGERWIFDSKVHSCAWKNWEQWPKGAQPHHLIFVADPQIIDPHSYPGRPWPLSALTVTVTDNYLRRGYKALQSHLHPDSLFFLGDLFDGGREWKTRQGKFVDPKWGSERSKDEEKWVSTWHNKYGEDFWIREYQRFANIFFDNWSLGGDTPGPYQRGRKLVASLPGNHDLGFGAQVQVPVRDRFSAFFGDVNRVDIVGNHSIVSVDAVSLSADSSQYIHDHDLRPIYGPVNEFLDGVQATKRKLVQEELSIWHDKERDIRYKHHVEDAETADNTRWLRDPGAGSPDFPTILLTHVPLFRESGTPCGPLREHWPPQKPPKGQTEPVFPDERNAITVAAGYQYQNVLSEQDSVKLLKSVGNVIHVFSGDDHDYCELEHSKSKGNVREITVKSMSMAMGVPTPGFQMVSLYNPVGPDGKPIPGSPEATMQTHLCLLPNQFHTYMTYIFFGLFSLALLAVRALLVPTLHLTPFALDAEGFATSGSTLPMFKDKAEPPEYLNGRRSASAATSSANGAMGWTAKKNNRRGAGWPGLGNGSGPRIKLDNVFYDEDKTWKASRGRAAVGTVGREMWTTSWRVAWMVVLVWAYLARKG